MIICHHVYVFGGVIYTFQKFVYQYRILCKNAKVVRKYFQPKLFAQMYKSCWHVVSFHPIDTQFSLLNGWSCVKHNHFMYRKSVGWFSWFS